MKRSFETMMEVTQDPFAPSQTYTIKPKSSRKGISRKAGVKKLTKKSVASICKQVLQGQAEVKSVQTLGAVSPRNALDTVANLAGNNVFQVSPNSILGDITQGTGPSQRVGNVCRLKKCQMDIVLYPKPYNVTNNADPRPMIVTFWCVSPKTGYESLNEMATLFDASFFQNNASSAGYASDLTDIVRIPNLDLVTVHWKRSYKLGHSTHYAQPDQTTEPYPSNVQFANNDYKMNHIIKFDFTKHCQKKIIYNDTSGIAIGKTVYLFCSIARADGTSFGTAADLPVDLWYQHRVEFTDI